MRQVTTTVLGSDWQSYRLVATDEPIKPPDEPVGGSDDVVYVRSVPSASFQPYSAHDRGVKGSLALGVVLTILGLWKLWDLTALALVALYRLLGG